MELAKDILKKRPHLHEKSVKTYGSVLKSIMKDLDMKTSKDLDDHKNVLKYLNEMPPNKRKTTLSALFVLTENDNYKSKMLEDIGEYNASVSKQDKNEKESENWITKDAVISLYDKMKKSANNIMKKGDLKMRDLQEIQNFIMLALFVLIPPRRALDYVEMKIKNVDKKTDNYIQGNKLVFNTYKTSKSKGQQIVDIPRELKTILNKWVKINPSEYLLFDAKNNKLSSVKINQRFEKIMGKKFSVNMFRKLFLTDKYGDTVKKMKEMEKDMIEMGSSKAQVNHYVKFEDEEE
jgi:integrase